MIEEKIEERGSRLIGLEMTQIEKMWIKSMMACRHDSMTLREDMKCRCGDPILICNHCGWPHCPTCIEKR